MHAETYLQEVVDIAYAIDPREIDDMAYALSKIKGRIYVVGLGGSLANAVHMASDLVNLCGIDARTPNIAQMTANMNDKGMEYAFQHDIHPDNEDGALFVLSVGGGTESVSTAITRIVRNAWDYKIPVFGIVGPDGGETVVYGDHVIRVPAPDKRVTPHTEAFQAVIWHCLVSHPLLQKRACKW